MAESNKDNNYNNELENNCNDTNENNEYPSNVVRVEPDLGLGSRTQHHEDRKRRNENSSRREEGPISFRHFLQNDAGPTSSGAYPDLYSCSRQERKNKDILIVDPDSPDLPDFVQDHLAIEHLYFNDGSQACVNTQNLPDFASCVPRNNNNERRMQHLPDNKPQSCVSVSLPLDLTTQANVAVNSGEVHSPVETEITSSGVRLPDFLSDSHMHGHNNPRHRDARISTSENGSGLDSYTERHNLIIMLRQENNRLQDELSMLQSILMKKDDRIKELEDLVMALEISKLQMSSDANTQTIGRTSAEEEVITLKIELETSKNEILKLQKEKLNSFAELCQLNLPECNAKERNVNLAVKVKEMTTASERLVRELLKIITEMQSDINVNDNRSISKNENVNSDPKDSVSGTAQQATSSV